MMAPRCTQPWQRGLRGNRGVSVQPWARGQSPGATRFGSGRKTSVANRHAGDQGPAPARTHPGAVCVCGRGPSRRGSRNVT